MYFQWVWVIAFAIFVVVELLNAALLTIWFAVGALVAAIFAFIGLDFAIQIAAFIVVSIAALFLTRPLAKKLLNRNGKELKTNAESLLGQQAIVTKTIGEYEYGQVKIAGQTWTAVSEPHSAVIQAGSEVLVKSISGVKLVVSNIQN